VTASAEDTVLRADEHRAVNDVLLALPVRQREVLVLRYHLGLSEAEIAEALDISRGAVKSHAHRGLAALRRALTPGPGTHDPEERR
jgi:RNA polymerase sigma factor (sigma-70 family)